MNPEDVYTLIPVTCEYHFLWQKRLASCDYVKDSEMRLSWIIGVGPVITWVPVRGRQEESEKKTGETIWYKEGTMSQGMQAASRNWNKTK